MSAPVDVDPAALSGVDAARTARGPLEAMGVVRFEQDAPESADLVARHSWPRTYVVGRSSVLTDEPIVAHALLGLLPQHMVVGAFERVSSIEPISEFRMTYLTACQRIGERVFGRLPDVDELAERLEALIGHARFAGVPLAAGWAATPRPPAVGARVERAATILREWRGGLHMLLLRAHGLLGADALLLHALWTDGDPGRLLRFYGWREPEPVEAAWLRLQASGRVDEHRALTDAGRREREHLERRTDELAAQPWDGLSPQERVRTMDLLVATNRRL